MIKKDYILRIIEEFGIMLAKIMKWRKENQPEKAQELIERCYTGFFKFDISFMNQMSGKEFMNWLDSQTLEEAQLSVLADLLNEEAEVFLLIHDEEKALDRFTKNLLILKYLDDLNSHTYSFSRARKITAVEHQIHALQKNNSSNTN